MLLAALLLAGSLIPPMAEVIPLNVPKAEAKTAKGMGETCIVHSLAKLKYEKTLEMRALVKKETDGKWFINGDRKAQAPNNQTQLQEFTCRLSSTGKLLMLNLFAEHTTSGKDVFEVYKE